jgi:RNA polymerase sigma-70 factor, ECF subfamily
VADPDVQQRSFLTRLKAGTDSAAGELYTRYIERLCQVATRLIGERLKRQYAAEDAAHSALGSFFRGMNQKRYQIDQAGRLWGLLVTIMRHKIQERGSKAREDILTADVVDADPSHEMAVQLADAVEAATAGLKPRHLEICRLFYHENLSAAEIAARIRYSRWTVRRVLNEFGGRLCDHLDDNSENRGRFCTQARF